MDLNPGMLDPSGLVEGLVKEVTLVSAYYRCLGACQEAYHSLPGHHGISTWVTADKQIFQAYSALTN